MRKRKSLEDRFWPKVRKSRKCWNWAASKDTWGYGQIMVRKADDRPTMAKAHRVSLFLHKGEWPPSDKMVCHKCDNAACVKPAHLYVGDQAANSRDVVARGRQRGERNPMAKLTDKQVKEIREMRKKGHLLREVGDMFGVAESTVSRIVHGKRRGR